MPTPSERREQCRRAQARYQRTEKGKATIARYRGGPRNRASHARYRAMHRDQVADENARRIFVGGHYRGRAQTVEQAAVIRQHVKERLDAFISRQQAGAEVEGVTESAVSTQAIT